MLEKLISTTGGKLALAVIAILAIGAIGFVVKGMADIENPGYGKQITADETVDIAEKAIKNLEADPNTPANIKAEMIAKYRADIARAKGENVGMSPASGAPANK